MDFMRSLCYNRQYMKYMLRQFFFVRKILSMAMRYVSGHFLGAAASVASMAGISMMSTLLASDLARVLLKLDIMFQHIPLLQIGTRILCCIIYISQCWIFLSHNIWSLANS